MVGLALALAPLVLACHVLLGFLATRHRVALAIQCLLPLSLEGCGRIVGRR
jgi:hypothetical protein